MNNQKQIKIIYLSFPGINFSQKDVHKIRGYLGNKFKEYDFFHNHDKETGKEIYRYPLIQCKIIDSKLYIMALDKACDIFKQVFFELQEIDIEGRIYALNEKELQVKESGIGIADKIISYQFITPWIALNQKNYKQYAQSNNIDKTEILKKCLKGNLLSMCHKTCGLDYFVSDEILCELDLKSEKIVLKGNSLIGFTGSFKVNFCLPEYIGIGKEPSRGFGTIIKSS